MVFVLMWPSLFMPKTDFVLSRETTNRGHIFKIEQVTIVQGPSACHNKSLSIISNNTLFFGKTYIRALVTELAYVDKIGSKFFN